MPTCQYHCADGAICGRPATDLWPPAAIMVCRYHLHQLTDAHGRGDQLPDHVRCLLYTITDCTLLSIDHTPGLLAGYRCLCDLAWPACSRYVKCIWLRRPADAVRWLADQLALGRQLALAQLAGTLMSTLAPVPRPPR